MRTDMDPDKGVEIGRNCYRLENGSRRGENIKEGTILKCVKGAVF